MKNEQPTISGNWKGRAWGGREGQEGVNSFSKILKHILNFQQIKLYRLGTQVGKRNTLKNIEGDQNTAWI